MKNLLFLLLVSPLLVLSQDNEVEDFFILENDIVIWQKTYETNKEINEMYLYLKQTGKYNEINIIEDKIVCELKPQTIDLKITPYSAMGVPVIVTLNDIKGIVVYEFKQGKYRVTFKNIILINNTDNAIYGKVGSEMSFEDAYVKKGKNEFKKPFTNKPKDIYNLNFSNWFDTIELKNDDDW